MTTVRRSRARSDRAADLHAPRRAREPAELRQPACSSSCSRPTAQSWQPPCSSWCRARCSNTSADLINVSAVAGRCHRRSLHRAYRLRPSTRPAQRAGQPYGSGGWDDQRRTPAARRGAHLVRAAEDDERTSRSSTASTSSRSSGTDQRVLHGALPASAAGSGRGVPQSPALTVDNFAIEGGVRVASVQVDSVVSTAGTRHRAAHRHGRRLLDLRAASGRLAGRRACRRPGSTRSWRR